MQGMGSPEPAPEHGGNARLTPHTFPLGQGPSVFWTRRSFGLAFVPNPGLRRW